MIEEQSEDPLGIGLDFESFKNSFDQASDFFFLSKEDFSSKQICMVANCGNLSSDRQI